MLRKTNGYTIAELMVAAAVTVILMAMIFVPYFTLQRGFNFAINWSESRNTQTRLLDCMARDLRNASAVSTSGSLPLTLTIPDRYGTYANTGAFSGEPATTSTFSIVQVNSTTGKASSGNTINVVYEQSGISINRRVVQSGVSPDVSRTVAIFPSGVSILFQNTAGAAYSSEDTIVPVVSATINSVSSSQAPISTIMTDTVFLRGANFK